MSALEWWQRGPVPDVPALLQPVAHMVLQLRDSVPELVGVLTESQWNARPAGVACAAFHVRHITGVLDRLFTYARGDTLDDAQFADLHAEGDHLAISDVPALLRRLDAQVEASLNALRRCDSATLSDHRAVGRAQLPSTVIGCLVHGGEHGMRHLGQLAVTVRILRQ